MREKTKIFVSAYACEPGKGSEIGVGWHWVIEMSKYYDIWVMTRKNNQDVIENYFSTHEEANCSIHWVYYDCPNIIKMFKRQTHGVRRYYTLWQILSNKIVKKTMEENNITVFHLLTYGNAMWHISKYGQKKFFIWGPTGGLDTIPREYAKYYTFHERILELIRIITVFFVRNSYSFNKKCASANLILCKAQSIMEAIPDKYKGKAVLFTDVAVDAQSLHKENTCVTVDTKIIKYVSVGRLDGWRGFDLILEAFSEAIKETSRISLKIIGDGHERTHLARMIREKNMESFVTMTGQISMEQYEKEMLDCDVVINACLKEGGVTNAFDCMKWEKPLICVDTGGYTRNFNESCAIILKKRNREMLINELSKSIVKLATDKETRRRMAQNMGKIGKELTWEIKGKKIKEIIDAVLQDNQL